MTVKEIKEKGLLLFECISGSRAYGLETLKSDTDLKGVFYLPKNDFYGLNDLPQVSNESNDEVYYELGRYVELLMKGNPNMLEMLACPEDCILYKHPIMDKLHLDMFLSKACKETFSAYAITQVRKSKGLKKKIMNPMPKERASVLDFCFVLQGPVSVDLKSWLERMGYKQEQCGLTSIPNSKGLFVLFYDAENAHGYKGIVAGNMANEVSLSSIPKGEKEIVYLFFNADAYSVYCKAFREYWEWAGQRNQRRYMDNLEHGKNYDAKNMMHTIRLLQVAEELVRTGKLKVRRSNRAELLAVRSGHFQYAELLKMADELIEKIELAELDSPLPEKVDYKKFENILIEMRMELYK